jgi:hypothetical protein
MPKILVLLFVRLLAIWLGLKPVSSIALSTLPLAAALTPGLLFITLETVAIETFDNLATSYIFISVPPSF